MTGTLINIMTVILGSAAGTLLRSRFPDRIRQMCRPYDDPRLDPGRAERRLHPAGHQSDP
jgi:hypothetical protein